MFKVIIRIVYATGIKRISDADSGCVAEGRSDVVFIVTFQITICNDVADLSGIVVPILSRQLSCHFINLSFQRMTNSKNTISLFQCILNRLNVFVLNFPQCHRARVASGSGVGNIKHIAKSRTVATGIQQSDTLRTTLHIAVHFLIPQVILCTGSCIRSLSVNHQLLMVGILIKATCGRQERSPSFTTASDLTGGIFCHSCVIRCLWCHQ